MNRYRATVLLASLTILACEDPFAEFLLPVPDVPTEETLVDFRVGALQDHSAFDGVRLRTVRVDQTGAWDFLFRTTETGEPQLAPFGAVAERFSEAGLQAVDREFEAIREAPEEGYVLDEPFAIAEGDVLVLITHRDPSFSGRCRHYAKIRVLEIDLEGGTMTFEHLTNPNCEDRVLEPGEHGEF